MANDSATDTELNRRAAETMGWTEIHSETSGGTDDVCDSRGQTWYTFMVGRKPSGVCDEIPRPATDIRDAMNLAEWWRKQSVGRWWRAGWAEGSPHATVGEYTEKWIQLGECPRALTLAVLQAVEAAMTNESPSDA